MSLFRSGTGADPGLQVRGAHLKKLRREEGAVKSRDLNYELIRHSIRHGL
jgi:hypothetical protein